MAFLLVQVSEQLFPFDDYFIKLPRVKITRSISCAVSQIESTYIYLTKMHILS